jgi:fructokinase
MRIGIDLGGTKIEIIALDGGGRPLLRRRVPTPRDYDTTILAIRDLVAAAETQLAENASVGVAIPGTISTRTGTVKNANSVWLNGHSLDKDLAHALERPVRIANDANCFALSEATDGAGKGSRAVFGVIAGTGVGGGICVETRVLTGAHGIAGEWGHNPLPAPRDDERPGPACYCGGRGCIESWISGPALERQFEMLSGRIADAASIAAYAQQNDAAASALMAQFYDRFARALASVVNILDPDAIVLGGGLSNIDALYRELPERIARYAFTPEAPIRVARNMHGDSSGVRGAAWLWADGEFAAARPG